MKMQDDDFDELFASKLNSFEVEPTAAVWNGIDAELKKGRYRKLLVPFLSVAASIVVLITAGILFIPPKTKGIWNTQAKGKITEAGLPLNGGPNIKSSPNITSTSPEITAIAKKPAYLRYKKARPRLNNEVQFIAKSEDSATEKAAEQLSLKPLNYNNDIINPAVPDENTAIAIKQQPDLPNTFRTLPVQTVAPLPGINKAIANTANPKHKLLSLGNLINTIVAKVDRRQDKIIEFTDNDDESHITAINLGVIKIKKDQQQTDK